MKEPQRSGSLSKLTLESRHAQQGKKRVRSSLPFPKLLFSFFSVLLGNGGHAIARLGLNHLFLLSRSNGHFFLFLLIFFIAKNIHFLELKQDSLLSLSPTSTFVNLNANAAIYLVSFWGERGSIFISNGVFHLLRREKTHEMKEKRGEENLKRNIFFAGNVSLCPGLEKFSRKESSFFLRR